MSLQPMFASGLMDTAEHHADLRASVQRLAAGFGRKYFQKLVSAGEKPHELWTALAEAGFLGAHVPEEFGGSGGGLADLGIVIEETAAQGCPLLSLVISSITIPILTAYGSQTQKREWLPALASGKRKMCFAITEPDAGSNSHRISTTARREGEGWVITGQKYWTSDIDASDAVLVVARDGEPDERGRAPLSLFIVPRDAPGLSFHPIDAALRAPEKQFTTFFDSVRIGPDALIGARGAGLRQVFVGLNPERVCAASINNGIARFAIAKAVEYVTTRKVWGPVIGAHQGVSHPLAEAYIGVQQARLMTVRAAQLYDSGQDAAEAANMAKFAAAESSLKALDQAIQVHGGNGLSYEYGLADLWFIARLHRTAPVSREMILNHVATHSLGLPKGY
jgi:alkylation response protein AidB-like acyl-CoA dehydrogenase